MTVVDSILLNIMFHNMESGAPSPGRFALDVRGDHADPIDPRPTAVRESTPI
jgi:hypothetical protein